MRPRSSVQKHMKIHTNRVEKLRIQKLSQTKNSSLPSNPSRPKFFFFLNFSNFLNLLRRNKVTAILQQPHDTILYVFIFVCFSSQHLHFH